MRADEGHFRGEEVGAGPVQVHDQEVADSLGTVQVGQKVSEEVLQTGSRQRYSIL